MEHHAQSGTLANSIQEINAMSSPKRDEVLRHLQSVGYVQPALHKQTHAPYPDAIDHALWRTYTRSVHDVGGEADVPIQYEEKEEEQ